jgi:hypothetical protein
VWNLEIDFPYELCHTIKCNFMSVGKVVSAVNERARYWLELADYDMESARVMLSGRRYLYVGFMWRD